MQSPAFKIRVIVSACTVCLLTMTAVTASAKAVIFANRQLCSCPAEGPADCTNMAKYQASTITCDWSKWVAGQDSNAQITFNGKQTVHGDCNFTGPDAILMITGKKHADVEGVSSLPGAKFAFDIKYQDDGSTTDDNQNILIYLTNSNNPSNQDKLVCKFTTAAAPPAVK